MIEGPIAPGAATPPAPPATAGDGPKPSLYVLDAFNFLFRAFLGGGGGNDVELCGHQPRRRQSRRSRLFITLGLFESVEDVFHLCATRVNND